MLSKCANPVCSNTFRYFHEGKLYLIDFKAGSGRSRSLTDSECTSKSRALEYLWLCSSCCRNMTIQIHEGCAITVVPT